MNTSLFSLVAVLFLFLGTSNNLLAQSGEIYLQTTGLQKNKFEQREESSNIVVGQSTYITEQRAANISLEGGFSIIKKNSVQYSLGLIYENYCNRTTRSTYDANYIYNNIDNYKGTNLGLKIAVGKRFNFKKILVLPQCGLAGIYNYGAESKNFSSLTGNGPFVGSTETLSEYGPSLTVQLSGQIGMYYSICKNMWLGANVVANWNNEFNYGQTNWETKTVGSNNTVSTGTLNTEGYSMALYPRLNISLRFGF